MAGPAENEEIVVEQHYCWMTDAMAERCETANIKTYRSLSSWCYSREVCRLPELYRRVKEEYRQDNKDWPEWL